MSRRGTLVYVLLALLLGGAYFLATRHSERKAEQASLARRVFDAQQAAVIGLEVRREGEPEVRIDRVPEDGGHGWRILSPLETAADRGAVDAVIRAALEAEKRRTLEGGDLDPAEYGLDRPALRVSLRTGGGSRAVEFGAESITGDARYARLVGGDEIFLVPAGTYNQMDLGLEALRDRRLMPLDRPALERITVRWSDARVQLVREKGAWRFARNPRPVSDTAVDGLIATLSETNVDRFVTDAEVPLEEYGLDSPDAMVTFEGGERRWVARFEKAAGEGEEPGLLAWRSTAPGIVGLPLTYLDRLPRSAADLEDQLLFRGNVSAVDAITMQAGGNEARFRKEGDAWVREDGPPDGEGEGSAPDAKALLELLGDLRHDGAPPRGGAMSKDATLSILLRGGEGEQLLDLRIGEALEGDGAHPGRLADDAGERDVLLSRFTLENLREGVRALAPDLVPADSQPEESAP